MKNLQKYRLLVQLLSIVLFTIGFFTQFTVTLSIVMVATIFAGAYYCGWICPYGTLQDIASFIGSKLGIKKRKMPKAIQKYLFYIRYILFGLFTLFTINIIFSLLVFDPRSNLLLLIGGHVITTISIIILVSFLVVALFFDRPFCNYLCIEGAKYGLVSLLRPVTIIRHTDSCINCKKCDKVCPMNIDISISQQLHSPNCINCFQCIDACPIKDTLTYRPIKVTKNSKSYYLRMAIIAGVLGLGFLVYNKVSDKIDYNDGVEDVLVREETMSQSTFIEPNIVEPNIVEPPLIDSEVIEEENTQGKGNGKRKNQGEHEETLISENDKSESLSDTADDSNNTLLSDSTNDSESLSVNEDNDTTTDIADATDTTDAREITDASGIPDGVYTGVGQGFRGNMTVEVTILNEEITKVEVVDYTDDYKWFVRAYDTIVNSIISSQSVDVNAVSGATYSSYGIIDGANAALEAARN